MKVPTIAELCCTIKAIKQTILEDDRAHEDSEVPGICFTVGFDPEGNWSYQLGNNEYHGAAYFFPYWIVRDIYRSSNCRVLAREIQGEMKEIPAPVA
jgi:hypothetical protein